MSQQWQGQLDQQIMIHSIATAKLDQCIGCVGAISEQCPLRNPDDYLMKKQMGSNIFKKFCF